MERAVLLLLPQHAAASTMYSFVVAAVGSASPQCASFACMNCRPASCLASAGPKTSAPGKPFGKRMPCSCCRLDISTCLAVKLGARDKPKPLVCMGGPARMYCWGCTGLVTGCWL
eukprot:355979-Chlamydomonas_euryale.AAC.6